MKNRTLECYRFIFAIVIALYHYRAQVSATFLPSGYLAVEFFFIISGFLLAQSATKALAGNTKMESPEIYTIRYIANKFKRLYPHYIFSFIVFCVVSVFLLEKYSILHVFRYGLPEIFMLQMSGLSNVDFTGNAADWYVSALMIASFLCCYLYVKNASTFRLFVCPSLSLMIYTYLYHEIGHLGGVRVFKLNTYVGTIRAMGGICLGCLCYELYIYIKQHFSMNMKARAILNIIDIICITAIIYRFTHQWKTTQDFLMLPIFMLFTLSIFLQESAIQKCLDNPISSYLGNISYAVFLNHTIIRDIFKWLGAFSPLLVRTLLYVAVVVGYSILTNYILNRFTSKCFILH